MSLHTVDYGCLDVEDNVVVSPLATQSVPLPSHRGVSRMTCVAI
jgi:hypothetical protein